MGLAVVRTDQVALLAEGVDRNIADFYFMNKTTRVALLAEGVDRNFTVDLSIASTGGRPPRGGRG